MENTDTEQDQEVWYSEGHAYNLQRFQEIRGSQWIPAVLNNPERGILNKIKRMIRKKQQRIGPSLFLQEINPIELQPYIDKFGIIADKFYLNRRKFRIKDEQFTPDACYKEIPGYFFKENFKLQSRDFDEENWKLITNWLDMTDLAIFSKISENWIAFMNTTEHIQIMNEKADIQRNIIQWFKKQLNLLTMQEIKNQMKLLYLQRRIIRIQQVQNILNNVDNTYCQQNSIQVLLNRQDYIQASICIQQQLDILNQYLNEMRSLQNYELHLQGIQEFVMKKINIQLDQIALSLLCHDLFSNQQALIGMLQTEDSYEKLKMWINEDYTKFYNLQNYLDIKIRSNILHNWLLGLTNNLILELRPLIKKFVKQIMDDQKNKWLQISHHKLVQFLKGISILFHSNMHRFEFLAQLIIQQLGFDVDGDTFYQKKMKIYEAGWIKTHQDSVSDLETIQKMIAGIYFSKVIKVIRIRADNGLNNQTSQINQIHGIVSNITNLWLILTGQPNTALKQALLQCEVQFVQQFHSKKCEEISEIIENDSWQKISPPDQIIAQIKETRAQIASQGSIKLQQPKFIVIAAQIVFYRTLYKYISLTEELTNIQQIIEYIFEYIKLYNSKCQQMIIGQGLLTMTREQHLQIKHFGLSAQNIAFIQQELPYVSCLLQPKLENFNQIFQQKQENVENDLKFHLQEITQQILSNFNNLSQAWCQNAVKEGRWVETLTINKLGNDYYIKQISKDLLTVYSKLHDVINFDQHLDILNQLFDITLEKLKWLANLIPIRNTSMLRLKNDFDYLIMQLRNKLSYEYEELIDQIEKRLKDLHESKLQFTI